MIINKTIFSLTLILLLPIIKDQIGNNINLMNYFEVPTMLPNEPFIARYNFSVDRPRLLNTQINFITSNPSKSYSLYDNNVFYTASREIVTITIPYQEIFSQNGTIDFRIYDNDKLLFLHYIDDFTYISDPIIDPNQGDIYYSHPNYTYALPTNNGTSVTPITYAEVYQFSNFEPIYETYSSRFSLSRYLFSYNLLKKELLHKNGKLLIEDKNNIFPLIPKKDQSSNIKEIPLELVHLGNSNYQIKLEKSLYLEPQTRRISVEPLLNGEETMDIIFPIQKLDSSGIRFTILFEKLGFNQLDLRFETTFIQNNLLIGDCSNSEYCIVSTLTNEEPPFYLEDK